MALTPPLEGVFSTVDIQKLEWSTIASAIAVSEKAKDFLLPIIIFCFKQALTTHKIYAINNSIKQRQARAYEPTHAHKTWFLFLINSNLSACLPVIQVNI